MNIIELANIYSFYYPIIMSIIWITGGLFFYFRRERKASIPNLTEYPMVSVLVPCHNEELVIEETVTMLLNLKYPNYELIVVDDGSTDNTPNVLKKLAEIHPLRVVLLTQNSGKPTALNAGLLACKGQIIVTVDADAFLDEKALIWIVWHFINYPRVGAVTANPKVRNRTSLLAKIQTAEYSSIIGLIKRTQRLLGKVMTVSGVATAFRLRALADVGLWDSDMITDDINMTWKLEKRFWDIRFEPNAICWMLVPETISGLWRQRKRWAQGGIEVLRKHYDVWLSWKCRRIWPVYLDQIFSTIWSVVFFTLSCIWLISLIIPGIKISFSPLFNWSGIILSVVCLTQFFVALHLDKKHDPTLPKYYLWVIWYPFIYWLLSALAVVFALPKGLFKPFGQAAIWKSPDRGYLPMEGEKYESDR